MKKLALFILFPLIFTACGDNNNTSDAYSVCMDNCKKFGNDYAFCKNDCTSSSSSGNNSSGGQNGGNNSSGGGNKTIQDIINNAKLTSSEKSMIQSYCEEQPSYCIEETEEALMKYKAVGCGELYLDNDFCDGDKMDSHDCYKQLDRCFFNNVEAYKSALDNLNALKAYEKTVKRISQCCTSWGGSSDECSEMSEEDNEEKYAMAIDFVIFEDDCLSANVTLWECEGQLKCDEPSYESDWPSEAICKEGEGAPIYKGNQYSSSTECFDSLTYHCNQEYKARKNACH